jgi:hypothetical protein
MFNHFLRLNPERFGQPPRFLILVIPLAKVLHEPLKFGVDKGLTHEVLLTMFGDEL